jgi:hypothetical protein
MKLLRRAKWSEGRKKQRRQFDMTTHLVGDAGKTLCGMDSSGVTIVERHPTCEECKDLDADRVARFENMKPETPLPWGQRRPKP